MTTDLGVDRCLELGDALEDDAGLVLVCREDCLGVDGREGERERGRELVGGM
jgi:hypothetical protein